MITESHPDLERGVALAPSRAGQRDNAGAHFEPVASIFYVADAELEKYLRVGIQAQLALLTERLAAANPAVS